MIANNKLRRTRFGAEFEMVSELSPCNLYDELTHIEGIRATNDFNARNGVFAVTTDSSINVGENCCEDCEDCDTSRCRDCHDCDAHPIEVKTPPMILNEYSLGKVKSVLKVLRRYGSINNSCGLHVHIEVLNRDYIESIMRIWGKYENQIVKFFPLSRAENSYCSLIATDIDYMVERVKENPSNCQRYSMVNPTCWHSNKTIEFRGHGGTLDYTKFRRWVLFCSRLVDMSYKFNNQDTLKHNLDNMDLWKFLNLSHIEKKYFKARELVFQNERSAREIERAEQEELARQRNEAREQREREQREGVQRIIDFISYSGVNFNIRVMRDLVRRMYFEREINPLTLPIEVLLKLSQNEEMINDLYSFETVRVQYNDLTYSISL